MTAMSKTTTPSGLVIEELSIGTGTEAAAGKNVRVHYTGWLLYGGEKGKKFHSPGRSATRLAWHWNINSTITCIYF